MRRFALAAMVLMSTFVPPAPGSAGSVDENLGPYRGLGAWVDLFEERAWRKPGRTVANMASHGVRTIYLETSNYSQPRSIVYPAGVSKFLTEAHRRDMEVVAWYLPGFARLRRDLQRSMAAINFRSASGQRFDSFALDIEASILDPPARRSRRLLALSRKIRARVGDDDTLGAIIPSPVGIELAGKRYWPGFPYAGLAEIYDVFVPMGYFTYHVNGPEKVHDETVRNVEIIREETGKPTVPIHVIGGIADDAGGAEVDAFVRAVREYGVLGASLYNWSLTRAHDWRPLESVPTNLVQSPPLPLPIPYAEPVGNATGADRSHPKEVFYLTGGQSGPRTLRFEAWDIQAGEVEVLINWTSIGSVPPNPAPGAWSATHAMSVPAELLAPKGENYVHFLAAGDHPDWREWAVRSVELVP
ncbi:MAG: hypothetical protein M3135_07245 [Actinomycetota bacterium]|nr:hypothetical protein [Actinomycetota bacterium]